MLHIFSFLLIIMTCSTLEINYLRLLEHLLRSIKKRFTIKKYITSKKVCLICLWLLYHELLNHCWVALITYLSSPVFWSWLFLIFWTNTSGCPTKHSSDIRKQFGSSLGTMGKCQVLLEKEIVDFRLWIKPTTNNIGRWYGTPNH